MAPSLNQVWLINPRSGNGLGANVQQALNQEASVKTELINFPQIDRQIEAVPCDTTLVIAGGDGTFSTALGTPAAAQRRIACIPLGTANDLSRECGVSQLIRGKSWREIPALIQALPSMNLAVWTVSADGFSRACTNYASIGFEGSVVCDFAQWRSRNRVASRLINRCAYSFFGARRSLERLINLKISYDNASPSLVPTTMGLTLTNIRSHLGLGISNQESLSTDQIIECVSTPNLMAFGRMITAQLGLSKPPSVIAKGAHLKITGIAAGTQLQIDGEECPPIFGGELSISFKHFAQVLSNRAQQISHRQSEELL